MLNAHGGMFLAREQPQAAPVNVHGTDPRRHRLGLLKMRIGSTHRIKSAEGEVSHLTARNADEFRQPDGTLAFGGKALELVCLHPACTGKKWPTEEAIKADPGHRSAELVKAGDRHVYGWFSSAPREAESARVVNAAKLLTRAKAFVDKARTESENAKDVDALNAALEKLDLAEKQVHELQRLVDGQKREIVGLVSDYPYDTEA